jgi:hypothetical protein
MSSPDVTVWEDDDEGIGFWDKLTPDEQAAAWDHGKHQAANYLDRIQGDTLGPPDHGEGPCGDCGHIAPTRWTLGPVDLCRRCIGSRHGAARHLNGEPARPAKPEPEPEPETSDPIEKVTFADATEVLHARAALAEDLPRPTTNGQHHDNDDLWQPPDF